MQGPTFDAEHLVVSSLQMKGVEEKLFSCGMPEEALMEKVGLLMKNWFLSNKEFLKDGVFILVGPGHNGGDGLVLARELHLLGIKVILWCPLPIKKKLTKKHLKYCTSLGIQQLKNQPDLNSNELWIEALFGLGQKRKMPIEIENILKKRDQLKPGNLISLDVPAGICSDSGNLLGAIAAKASYTLTVGLIKTGLIQDAALPYVGNLIRLDIGIPEIFLSQLMPSPLRLSSLDLNLFDLPKISPKAGKYERGRVFLIAGSNNFKGASLLALKGALASGAGSVQAVMTDKIADFLWPIVPEVIFHHCSQVSKTNDDVQIRNSLNKINFDRIDSLLIGPGLGISDEDWGEAAFLLKGFKGLLVIDADGLNRISLSNDGWKWLCKRSGPTWITPHITEFRRLFPSLREVLLQATKRKLASLFLPNLFRRSLII